MLSERMQKSLNDQIKLEGDSSQIYLSMAVWSETKGMEGVAKFMYDHADEERQHMLKIIRFVNERGGVAIVPDVAKPTSNFVSLKKMFEILFNHEVMVSKKINDIVHVSLEERDYASNNFLQWYVSEQIEEEALARMVLDKINMIGDDKGGLYLFDNDIKTIVAQAGTGPQ
ncbi:MAG: ferritin [Flavobacteriales bacterium]|nr:ferritin [Flavobacteriales bacterium]